MVNADVQPYIDTRKLEEMVDSYGLPALLDTLATICGEKADHLESSWQDVAAGKLWNRASREIEKARIKIAAIGLPIPPLPM